MTQQTGEKTKRHSLTAMLAVAGHRPTIISNYDELKLLSVKPASHGYSSLRDLLPSVGAVNSPKPKPIVPGSDIRIRNSLVKQAALAYLQPMSASPGSTGGSFVHRIWSRVAAFIDFLCTNVIWVLDRTLRFVGFRSSGLQRSKMCFV